MTKITMDKFYCTGSALSNFTDSMLFDSDSETIASMKCTNSTGHTVEISLEIRGYVTVEIDGELYYAPSEFPDEFTEFIKNNPDWQLCPENYDGVFEVRENNWFEYLYSYDGMVYDGILFEDDLSKYTEDELKKEMYNLCCELLADNEPKENTPAKKIMLECEKYNIVAEVSSYDNNHTELAVYIETKDGSALQDIALVRPHTIITTGEVKEDSVDCLVWTDSGDEDYSEINEINVRDESDLI